MVKCEDVVVLAEGEEQECHPAPDSRLDIMSRGDTRTLSPSGQDFLHTSFSFYRSHSASVTDSAVLRELAQARTIVGVYLGVMTWEVWHAVEIVVLDKQTANSR